MTIEEQRPSHSSRAHAGPLHLAQEDALQAYLRRRHEASGGQDGNGEPQRGRDPWLGLAL